MNAKSRNTLRAALTTALLLGAVVPAVARPVATEVLGLHPGMSDIEVRERLQKIGEVVRGQDLLKQTWKLRDKRYGYLVLRYDENWRMHWVTAFAREGGRRVRYGDIGDLSLATHTGQHFYSWIVPANSGAGSWTVVARGSGPRYVESISISTAMRQDLVARPRPEGISAH